MTGRRPPAAVGGEVGGPAREGTAAPVVVVGAGISGLAAGWELSRAGVPVVLLEAEGRVGGVMARGALDVPGRREPLVVDLGPESLLARRPEALALLGELGLADEVVSPEPLPAAVATRGRLHGLPPGTVMGVPRTTEHLGGVLTPEEVARVAAEERVEPVGADDVDVASWVAGRVGRAVVDRLVEPLLGGVYAGSAGSLSLRATVPPLWDLAVRGAPLLAGPAGRGDGSAPGPAGAGAAGAPTTAGAPAAGPVFAGLRGGVGRLAEELGDRLVREGVDLRLRTPATSLHRAAPTPGDDGSRAGAARWVVRTPGGGVPARAVVVALPAPAAARLLAEVAPAAASELRRVRTASSAIGTLVVPGAVLAGVRRSGVLVPPAEGGLVKASTFSSAKWGWLADAAAAGAPADGTGEGPPAVLRVSVGRAGEDGVLERDDADLLRAAAVELAALLGGRDVPVLAGRVVRWRDGLPQYDVGHLDVVARVRADVAGHRGLAVAGSAYEGVGVPACIASGRRAARELLEQVDQPGAGPGAGARAGLGP